MNIATVTGATAALARWLPGRDPEAARKGVVIGHDARHRSDEFARHAARVLAGAGIRVHLLPGQLPTPVLAYSVRALGAAAGVMITASHNPREDNGYKLYLDDGAQIIPPADSDIEAAIDEVGPLADVPLAAADSELISPAGDAIVQSYLDAICALTPAPPSAAWLRFVYTPLHGVAGRLALRAFAQAGYAEPDLVEAQFEPDPDFPTVHYPNPEEPGTLDLSLALARRSAADLVIANDPDGDRLAVAVPDPDAAGGWRVLTGDQVGALLGWFLLDRLAAEPDTDMASQLVVATIVSGTLLSKIAAAAGAQYAQTLTGFKWISRAGDLREGAHFVFGYEEALGYEVTQTVRDKDGMSAALAILSLAAGGPVGRRVAARRLQRAGDRSRRAPDRAAQPAVRHDDRGNGPATGGGAAGAGRSARHVRHRLHRRQLAAALRRRAELPAHRCQGGDQAERHRAEDQGLPRGGAAGQLRHAERRAADRRRADGAAAGSDRGAARGLVGDADDHVRGLDDRDHVHALGQAEFGGGLGRDGGDQAHAAGVQLDVGGGLAPGDARHLRRDLVTGAEPHGFRSHPLPGSCRHSAATGAAATAFAVRAPWWQARDHGESAATRP